ncbi:MAG: MarR family winged helix-turn-helix transcriptional regulator [Spirochaetia bacterium]|nr:MarR family winged helix-turn-helix transcriptional regulator [Spirochaetia bacterium]
MGMKVHGTSAEIQALKTFVKLMRAYNSVLAALRIRLDRLNLPISQFAVLEALYNLGPMNQKDLSTKLLKSEGNMTTVVNNLVEKQYISRNRSRDDRREIIISLTSTGRTFIHKIFPDHVKDIARVMSILSPGEIKQLEVLLRKLGLGIQHGLLESH